MEYNVLLRIKFNSGVNMLLCFSALSKSKDGESANGPLQSAAVAIRSTYHHNSAAEGEVRHLSQFYSRCLCAAPAKKPREQLTLCAIKKPEYILRFLAEPGCHRADVY